MNAYWNAFVAGFLPDELTLAQKIVRSVSLVVITPFIVWGALVAWKLMGIYLAHKVYG